MTSERQNISSEFYSSNDKDIVVSITDSNGKKDLTSAEITYVLMTDKYEEVLRKSTVGGGITIETPASDGVCTVHIYARDIPNLHGTFRHEMNVVDSAGYEETVMTGTVNIFRSLSKRQRTSSVPAYIQGI